MAGLRHMRVKLRVKEICEQRGLSRTWLSHRAEIQYNTVSGIWNNPNRDISLLTLLKIAQALNVSILDLYEVLPDE